MKQWDMFQEAICTLGLENEAICIGSRKFESELDWMGLLIL